jgi:3-oxoacyl-(acyl-carrier-protein) synthase/acyl carrier protein
MTSTSHYWHHTIQGQMRLPRQKDRTSEQRFCALLSVLTGTSLSSAASEAKFVDMGLDSLAGVEFAGALRAAFDVDVRDTVIFDHPTIQDLAHAITGMQRQSVMEVHTSELPGDGILRRAHVIEEEPNRHVTLLQDVAFKLPSTDALGSWIRGQDVQVVVPSSRWDVDAYYDPIHREQRMNVRFGGWLQGVDQFDAPLFGLTPGEGIAIDPQIRMLLELTHDLVSARPYVRAADNVTSNFVGCMYHEYLDGVLKTAGMADTSSAAITSTGMSFLVGRINYHYNMRGESVSCDTACSSSLVSVHLAGQAARRHGLSYGSSLAHGVNLMLIPQTTARICMLHALSPDGRCKTADATADGYGRCESAVSVLISGYSVGSSTDENGCEIPPDHIAVLNASGVAHNGMAAGISAPHGPSQASLVASVWRKATIYSFGVDCVSISLHGTGTALGDPIEFQALQDALCKGRRETVPSSISSVMSTKACFGHTEGAAGLVGLVIPLLRCAVVAPMTHLRELNRHVAREGLNGLQVSRQQGPRISRSILASSSFGMGGTNAHAIVALPEAPLEGHGEIPRVFAKRPCWPLVQTSIMPCRLALATNQEIAVDVVISRGVSWMSDHVVNHQTLLAGATMATVLLHVGHLVGVSSVHGTLCSVAFTAAVQLPLDASSWNPLRVAVNAPRGKDALMGRLFSSWNGLDACRATYTYSAPALNSSPPKRGRRVCLLTLPVEENRASQHVAFISGQLPGMASAATPLVMDASMHLALVSKSESRLPVGIDAFKCTDESMPRNRTACSVETAPGVIESRSSCPWRPTTILCGVQSKPQTITMRSRGASLRARTWVGSLARDATTQPRHLIVESTDLSMKNVSPRQCHDAQPWNDLLSVVQHAIRGLGRLGTAAKSRTALRIDASQVLAVDAMAQALALTAPREYRHRVEMVAAAVSAASEREAGKFSEDVLVDRPSFESPILSRPGETIVTGAFGGIGSLVRCWLNQGNEQAPILLGRRLPRRRGHATVPNSGTFVQCDVSSSSDCVSFSFRRRMGVVHHVSGTLRDRMIHEIGPSDVRTTVSGKADGNWQTWMTTFAPLGGLNYTLFYSSVSSLIGNPGQTSYAYANGLLNRLASLQNSRGIHTCSIAWGAWAGLGMAAGQETAIAARGVLPMQPQTGLDLLEVVIHRLDTRTYSHTHRDHSVVVAGTFRDGLFSETSSEKSLEEGRKPTPATHNIVETPAGNAKEEGRRTMSTIDSMVRGTLRDILDSDADQIDADSLQSVQIVDALSSAVGIPLSPTLLYDYPSISHLVQFLVEAVGADTESFEDQDSFELEVKELFALPPGCWCSPTIDELNRMAEAALSSVSGFTMGRVDGRVEVRWIEPVDLRSARSLATVIRIKKHDVVIARGSGIDRRATIDLTLSREKATKMHNLLLSKGFEQVKLIDKLGGTVVRFER